MNMGKRMMWKRWAGLFLLCILLLAPQMTSYAEKDEDEYTDEADDDEIADAVNRLSRYYKNLKLINGDDLDQAQLKELEKICNDGRNYIAGTDDITRSQVETHVSETKSLMDAYVEKCLSLRPQSTIDYLAVGNMYDSPVAGYGEGVVLILPILNLGEETLTNVIVTPVISNSVKEWPFEISRTGYAEEMAWVGLVNNCRARADEIILSELVYV